MNVEDLKSRVPIIEQLEKKEEVCWINPQKSSTKEALEKLHLSMRDVKEAEERLTRFAPFIMKEFPETKETGGLIESPLKEICNMKEVLNHDWKAGLNGRLLLKMDSELAVAGSVKARGGIYEILKYAESLALKEGLIHKEDGYEKFAEPFMKDFFSKYSVHVGSTGNLGLSIGIISAAVGFQVSVHMSADAKQWKKDLLRKKGVNVIEYAGDYGKAVEKGRAEAESDPMSYFVDDENSENLFLGYAVAALRLKKQLEEQHVTVDESHPLFVYVPCGVGGAPGGVTFGLKLLYGDNVHVFYEEPTEACCMLLGIATGLHNEICVQDIGLSGKTEADGLAVGRASKFVGRAVCQLLSGEFTIKDNSLYIFMKQLLDSEKIFIEPSSCAAFAGPARMETNQVCKAYIREQGLSDKMEKASHIVWATGGSLVPKEIRAEYYEMGVKQQG